MLVRGVVVEDDVDFQLRVHLPDDALHEAQELLMPVPLRAVPHDLAGGDVQRRKEGGGAVPLVVVRHRSCPPLLERQPGLRAIQRLDLALLVDREHHRPLRRRNIQPDHVLQLLDEVRILRELERLDPVRLQAVSLPDPAHALGAQIHMRSQRARAPMRSRTRGRTLLGQPNDLGLLLGSDLLRLARAGPVAQQPRESALLVPVQPAHHCRRRHANARADLLVFQTGGRGENDAGALNHPLGCRARTDQALQLSLVSVAQLDCANRHWHTEQSNTR